MYGPFIIGLCVPFQSVFAAGVTFLLQDPCKRVFISDAETLFNGIRVRVLVGKQALVPGNAGGSSGAHFMSRECSQGTRVAVRIHTSFLGNAAHRMRAKV